MASLSPDTEAIPEYEVLDMNMEGDEKDCAKVRWENCTKNPGHPRFIPVNEFRMEHLPVGKRTPEMMDRVFGQSVLTVRVRVAYTSKERPDTFADSDVPYPYIQYRGTTVPRYGTGGIQRVFYHQPVKGMRCPCPECKDSENPKTQFWWIVVRTSTRVIYDRSEAECSEFECFYDSEDKAQVQKLYGFDIFSQDSNLSYRHDACNLLCVTHDIEMVAILNRIQSTPFNGSDKVTLVIVSHPHGRSKHITVGDILHATVPLGPTFPVNKAIPFGKATIIRKKWQTGLGSKTDGPEPSQQSDLFNQLDDNTFRDRLESIRASLDLPTEDNTTNFSSVIPPTQTKDDYWLEFCNSFLREGFLTTSVLSTFFVKMVAGKSDDPINAIDYVFNRFLGPDSIYDRQESREEDLASESEGSERDKDGGKVKTDELIWKNLEELFARSEELYVQYLKDKTHGGAHTGGSGGSGGSGLGACGGYDGGTVPIIVRLFEQIGNSMDSIRSELANKGEIITGDVIIEAMAEHICVGNEWIRKIVERDWNETKSCGENITKDELNKESCGDQKQKVDGKKSNHSGDGNRKKGEYGEEGESVVGTMDGKAEREKEDQQGEGRGDSGVGEGGGRERGGETMWFVPQGASFILPSDAEYAFRAYPRNPRWFSFPPGTLMIFPADADLNNPPNDPVSTGEPLFEFYQRDENWLSVFRYLTYNTDMCPGSSGASVPCDILQDIKLYFPHAGGVKDAKRGNQSGVVECWT